MTTVVLADGLRMFRDAVHALLERSGSYEVVASVDDGLEALDAIRKHRPEMVIAETQLPRLGGIDVARRARQEDIAARFLFLTGSEDARTVGDAFGVGALGYVCKSDPATQLIHAIEAVRADQTHVSPSVTEHLVRLAVGLETASSGAGSLTCREREVLKLVAEGMSSKEIGQLLHLSARTVDTHRANIMDKLGIHKVSGLVRFAIREGMLSP